MVTGLLRTNVAPCSMAFDMEDAAWEVLPCHTISREGSVHAAGLCMRACLPTMNFALDGPAWDTLPEHVIANDVSSDQGLPEDLGCLPRYFSFYTLMTDALVRKRKTRQQRQKEVLQFHNSVRARRHSCREACSHVCEESCGRWAKLYDYHGRKREPQRNLFTEILPTDSDDQLQRERRLRRQLWLQRLAMLRQELGSQLVVFPRERCWPQLPVSKALESRRLLKLRALQSLQCRERSAKRSRNTAGLQRKMCKAVPLRRGKRWLEAVAALPSDLRCCIWSFWMPYQTDQWHHASVLAPMSACPENLQAARRVFHMQRIFTDRLERTSFSGLPVQSLLPSSGNSSRRWHAKICLRVWFLQRRMFRLWLSHVDKKFDCPWRFGYNKWDYRSDRWPRRSSASDCSTRCSITRMSDTSFTSALSDTWEHSCNLYFDIASAARHACVGDSFMSRFSDSTLFFARLT